MPNARSCRVPVVWEVMIFFYFQGGGDLYGDNPSSPAHEQPVPRWIIALKRANYVQPTLDPTIGRLKLTG